MRFNLTFNKPAATMFFGTDDVKSIKVKIEDGNVSFRTSTTESGKDVFPLSPRTRGGVGITLEGKFAEEFIAATGLDRGHHLTLEEGDHKWITATLFTEQSKTGKPSKIIPTARLWRVVDETGSKAEVAPAKAPRASRASAAKKTAKKGAAKPAASAKKEKAAAPKKSRSTKSEAAQQAAA